MPKEFSRTQRVGEQIKRELAQIIQREIYEPQWGMLTLSEVEVSPDLKYARVYISVFGGDWSIDQTLQYLNKEASNGLRHALSQRLTTRTTPRLQFIKDSSIEEGFRLSALIDDAVQKSDK